VRRGEIEAGETRIELRKNLPGCDRVTTIVWLILVFQIQVFRE